MAGRAIIVFVSDVGGIILGQHVRSSETMGIPPYAIERTDRQRGTVTLVVCPPHMVGIVYRRHLDR